MTICILIGYKFNEEISNNSFKISKYKKWKSFSALKSYKTIRISTSFRYSRFIQCSPAIFLCQDVWQYNGGKDYVGLQS